MEKITPKDLQEILQLDDFVLNELLTKYPELLSVSCTNFKNNVARLLKLHFKLNDITTLAFHGSKFVFGDYEKETENVLELQKIMEHFNLSPQETCHFINFNEKAIAPNLTNHLHYKYHILTKNYHLTSETAIKILCNTSCYTDEELFNLIPKNIKVLEKYGFNLNKLCGNVYILNNQPQNVDTKLKLALLNDVSYMSFFSTAYKFSAKIVYARQKAIETGLSTEKLSPYTKEGFIVRATGLTSQELTQKFPLDEKALLEIDKQFALKLPKLAPAILDEKYEQIIAIIQTENIEKTKQLQALNINNSTIIYLKEKASLTDNEIITLFSSYNINETALINMIEFLTTKFGLYPQDIKRMLIYNINIISLTPTEIMQLYSSFKTKQNISVKDFKIYLVTNNLASKHNTTDFSELQ